MTVLYDAILSILDTFLPVVDFNTTITLNQITAYVVVVCIMVLVIRYILQLFKVVK